GGGRFPAPGSLPPRGAAVVRPLPFAAGATGRPAPPLRPGGVGGLLPPALSRGLVLPRPRPPPPLSEQGDRRFAHPRPHAAADGQPVHAPARAGGAARVAAAEGADRGIGPLRPGAGPRRAAPADAGGGPPAGRDGAGAGRPGGGGAAAGLPARGAGERGP